MRARWAPWLIAVLTACGTRGEVVPSNRGELKLELVPGGAPLVEQTAELGALQVGSSLEVRVRALNTGADALTVTSVRLESADTGAFFVRGDPGRLEPDAGADLTVTFAPVRVGAQTARLVLSHDAKAASPAIDFSGTGR